MWTSTRRTRAAHAHTLTAGGCRRRRTGVLRARRMHRAEPPSPASTAEADTIAPLPESGEHRRRHLPRDRLPGALRDHRPRRLGDLDGAAWARTTRISRSQAMAPCFSASPRYVPTDACAWKGALVQIDPTTEAFVDAMTAQASTMTTLAVEVVVGDYSGLEFDYAVESDVDFTDCDGGRSASTRTRRRTATLDAVREGKASLKDLPSGRPERRARCDRGGPIPRIDRSGADRRGTRHLRLDRVRRTRRMTPWHDDQLRSRGAEASSVRESRCRFKHTERDEHPIDEVSGPDDGLKQSEDYSPEAPIRDGDEVEGCADIGEEEEAAPGAGVGRR